MEVYIYDPTDPSLPFSMKINMDSDLEPMSNSTTTPIGEPVEGHVYCYNKSDDSWTLLVDNRGKDIWHTLSHERDTCFTVNIPREYTSVRPSNSQADAVDLTKQIFFAITKADEQIDKLSDLINLKLGNEQIEANLLEWRQFRGKLMLLDTKKPNVTLPKEPKIIINGEF